MRRLGHPLLLVTLAACVRQDPPGAGAGAEPAVVQTDPPAGGEPESQTPRGKSIAKEVLGTDRDNLPFEPDGTKLGSIAWRTWVYTDIGAQRTRFGYLRAGSVMDARGPAIVNDGCAGGWYRVNPRGFVCVGKGATLDLKHPVLVATNVRPVRGQALPYLYARAGENPPFRYFRLAKLSEMETVEGEGLRARAKLWKDNLNANGLKELIGEPGPPPEFLSPVGATIKPYGVPKHLHFSAHAGRSAADSGFAIQRVFTHEERTFGLTTELDIIALDRTKVVRPSAFRGAELEKGENLPVLFIQSHLAPRYRLEENQLIRDGSFEHRQAVKLTGKRHQAFWETTDGHYVAMDGTRKVPARDSFPSFATGNRKWIDISIRDQSLVAYAGTRPVYATLISAGRGGLADPEKTHATARGTFMVYSKHVSATMDGDEDKSDSYNLLDVPFVQYFHKGYALHGTYWHDEYGRERSHGCVNLSPIDAAWIFEWTDPPVPPGWHAVLNKERGTVVLVRP